jgi:AraC-like DNA-binding protein
VQEPRVWPAVPDLHGLVDLAYSLHVRAQGGRVLPDGRAGLVWLSDGTVRVCGPETRPWRPLRSGVDVVGIRLALGVVPAVLGVPAHVLTDRRVHLQDLWGPSAADLAAQITRVRDPYAQAVLLQEAVRTRAVSAMHVDPVARHLARRLDSERMAVRELAKEVGLSERQLRRRCETAFGYPPSVLGRLLRLHRFLSAARTAGAGVQLVDLAVSTGYADQAHLARETRTLAGSRPSAFLPTAERGSRVRSVQDDDG